MEGFDDVSDDVTLKKETDELIEMLKFELPDSDDEKEKKKKEEEDEGEIDEDEKISAGPVAVVDIKLGGKKVVRKRFLSFAKKPGVKARKRKKRNFLMGKSVNAAVSEMKKDRVVEVPGGSPPVAPTGGSKDAPGAVDVPSTDVEIEGDIAFYDPAMDELGADFIGFIEVPEVPPMMVPVEPMPVKPLPSGRSKPVEKKKKKTTEKKKEDVFIEDVEPIVFVDPEEHERRKKMLEFKREKVKKLKKILEIKRLKRRIQKSQNCDLVFLVDCTGTMQSGIDGVKRNCIKITKVVSKTFKNFKMRVGFVGYRDYQAKRRVDEIPSKRFEILKLGDVSRLQGFLEKIKASGGGDVAEDVFGGLEQVHNLDFDEEYPTRILIHIADAPCHGSEYHDPSHRIEDYYPEGDPGKRDPTELLGFLRNNRVHYFFIQMPDVISDRITTNVMLWKFKEIYEKDNKDSIHEGMKLVVFQHGQPFLRLFIKAINESIQVSMGYAQFMAMGKVKRRRKKNTLEL